MNITTYTPYTVAISGSPPVVTQKRKKKILELWRKLQQQKFIQNASMLQEDRITAHAEKDNMYFSTNTI